MWNFGAAKADERAAYSRRTELEDQHDRLWEQENKILPVQISTATTLDEATVQQIGDRIAKDTGQKIELTADVDPDILGGIVLRVGNSILDASIRNRLDNLRKHVARGA